MSDATTPTPSVFDLTCHACGYSLRGVCSLEQPDGKCPECGQAFNYDEAVRRAFQGPPAPAWVWDWWWLIVVIGPFAALAGTIGLDIALKWLFNGWHPWIEYIVPIPLVLQLAATVYASFCITFSNSPNTRPPSTAGRIIMAMVLTPVLLACQGALVFFVSCAIGLVVVIAGELLG